MLAACFLPCLLVARVTDPRSVNVCMCVGFFGGGQVAAVAFLQVTMSVFVLLYYASVSICMRESAREREREMNDLFMDPILNYTQRTFVCLCVFVCVVSVSEFCVCVCE